MMLKMFSCADLSLSPLCWSTYWWILWFLCCFEYIAKHHRRVYIARVTEICVGRQGNVREKSAIFFLPAPWQPCTSFALSILSEFTIQHDRFFITFNYSSCLLISSFVLILLYLSPHPNYTEYLHKFVNRTSGAILRYCQTSNISCTLVLGFGATYIRGLTVVQYYTIMNTGMLRMAWNIHHDSELEKNKKASGHTLPSQARYEVSFGSILKKN